MNLLNLYRADLRIYVLADSVEEANAVVAETLDTDRIEMAGWTTEEVEEEE